MTEELEQSAEETLDAQDEAQEYAPGELAPCIVTQAKVWKSDDLKRENLLEPIRGLIKSLPLDGDLARRFNVLETWEARLMDRGHQHLSAEGEGFRVAGAPGEDKRNSLAELANAGINNTNVFSAQGDICTGVLNRGKIRVSFSPRKSKRPQDVAAADAGNSYKFLWEKNNPNLQKDITNCAWTDCRSLVWTRTIADKRFGLDDEGNPRQMEVSSAFGALESRLPMLQDSLKDCSYAQIFEESDYATQRACFPWTGKKIKPGAGSDVDHEFERIARISTRTGIGSRLGSDGGSASRSCTMTYTWLRPSTFFSDCIKDEEKDALLKAFPDGIFVIMTGSEVCAAWEESMDAHLSDGMFTRGNGQSRRALGSSDVAIQRKINIWAELFDQFCRSAIPTTLVDSAAIDTDALASLEASPRRYFPVAVDTAAGQTIASITGQTPTPTPQPAMMDLFNAYTGPLLQAIDGATPALFGGGNGDDTATGATLRLNQALERFGPCWMVVNSIIAKAVEQAARLCGDNATEDIEESVDGKDLCVNPAALRGGNFSCSSETAGTIPESAAAREAKLSMVLEMANTNQSLASLIAKPQNTKQILAGLHLEDVLSLSESDSCDKQNEEIQIMLEQPPLINPAYSEVEAQIAQATQTHEAAKAAVVQSGTVPHPENIQKGQQLEQAIEALQQKLQSTPQWIPSVPVAGDGSEDDATEEGVVFDFLQTPEGRGIRYKSSRETPGGDMNTSPNWCKFTNLILHWQAHRAAAAQFAKPAPVQPKVNLTGKVSPSAVTQMLSSAGVQIDPQAEQQPEISQTLREYGPTSETETHIRQNGATK
jgi:hypothetical protein